MTRGFTADTLFLPSQTALLMEPARPKRLSRVFGWAYQIVLWSVLILGTVHTVHQRLLSPDSETSRAQATASRGVDYLTSLLFP